MDKEEILRQINEYRINQFIKYGFPEKFNEPCYESYNWDDIYALAETDYKLWFYCNNDYLPCKMRIIELTPSLDHTAVTKTTSYINVLVHPAKMVYNDDIKGIEFEINDNIAVEYVPNENTEPETKCISMLHELPYTHDDLTINREIEKDYHKHGKNYSLFIVKDSFTAGALAVYRRRH